MNLVGFTSPSEKVYGCRAPAHITSEGKPTFRNWLAAMSTRTSSGIGLLCRIDPRLPMKSTLLASAELDSQPRERMEVSVGLSCLVDSACSPKVSTKFTTVYVVTAMRSTGPHATSNLPSALHDDVVNNIAVLHFRTRRKLNQISPIAKKNPPRVINLSTRQLSPTETSILSRKNICR